MQIRTKIRIAKIGAPILLFSAVFGLLRVVLPRVGESRLSFDLGAGYQAIASDRVRVYFHPDATSVDKAKLFGVEAVSFVDRMTKRYGETLGLTVPSQQFAFIMHRDGEDLNRFWRVSKDDTVDKAGLYSPTKRLLGLYVRKRDDQTLTTLRHELTHMMLDLSGLSGGGNQPMPRWLDEGLAKYFEHGVEGGVSGGYADGEMPVPLDFLVKLKAKAFYGKEHGSDHYLESNLLVAFFMTDNDGAWRERFLTFVRLSGRRFSDLAEIVVASGLDEETFQLRFKAFVIAAAAASAPSEETPAEAGTSPSPKDRDGAERSQPRREEDGKAPAPGSPEEKRPMPATTGG